MNDLFNLKNIQEIKEFILNTPINQAMNLALSAREKTYGGRTQLCSIINAKSGYCSENCKFCAQSIYHNAEIDKYHLMSSSQILDIAQSLAKNGISNIGIVTSGNSLSSSEIESICSAISLIKKTLDIKVCASLGQIDTNALDQLKNAGLDKYHHNFETSRSFFSEICTSHTWEDRLKTVMLVKKSGLDLCSGGLFGIGESWEDRILLALELKKLGIDDVPINFLSPIKGTPCANVGVLSSNEAILIIVLFRLLLPSSTIRICGGRATVFSRCEQKNILLAGANALMTGDYLTTSGISTEVDRKLIAELGMSL